jgi:hypothetical protein
MKVSDVQQVVEDGYKTKLIVIEEADSYSDVVKEVTDFLWRKSKCFFGKRVTVAVSVKFPVPKEYSDAILKAQQEIGAP